MRDLPGYIYDPETNRYYPSGGGATRQATPSQKAILTASKLASRRKKSTMHQYLEKAWGYHATVLPGGDLLQIQRFSKHSLAMNLPFDISGSISRLLPLHSALRIRLLRSPHPIIPEFANPLRGHLLRQLSACTWSEESEDLEIDSTVWTSRDYEFAAISKRYLLGARKNTFEGYNIDIFNEDWKHRVCYFKGDTSLVRFACVDHHVADRFIIGLDHRVFSLRPESIDPCITSGYDLDAIDGNSVPADHLFSGRKRTEIVFCVKQFPFSNEILIGTAGGAVHIMDSNRPLISKLRMALPSGQAAKSIFTLNDNKTLLCATLHGQLHLMDTRWPDKSALMINSEKLAFSKSFDFQAVSEQTNVIYGFDRELRIALAWDMRNFTRPAAAMHFGTSMTEMHNIFLSSDQIAHLAYSHG